MRSIIKGNNTGKLGNEFDVTMASTQREDPDAQQWDTWPLCIIATGTEAVIDENVGQIGKHLPIGIGIATAYDPDQPDETADYLLNQLQANVESAILGDRDTNTLVQDYKLLGAIPWEPEVGYPMVGRIVMVDAHYWHSNIDPDYKS
jgi:hypothetical protein